MNNPIVFVGLILDTEHAFRLVDHGPAADNTDSEAARQFRDLWGDKAELRRFKDGSITESVVWEVKNADERATQGRLPRFSPDHPAIVEWRAMTVILLCVASNPVGV